MAYDRQWLVSLLRHLGFPDQAEEALRDLPAKIDHKRLLEFADWHGINRGMLTDRMGGSP
jgi:hypothetical protein